MQRRPQILIRASSEMLSEKRVGGEADLDSAPGFFFFRCSFFSSFFILSSLSHRGHCHCSIFLSFVSTLNAKKKEKENKQTEALLTFPE